MSLWLLSAVALGQAPEDEPGKVSNDQPGRPLQMPPASSDVKEALDDFDRFRRRDAWERALKALYTIPEDQARRFVDGEDGFIITVASRRRSLLSALPPEGQAAYRLFYDAEAQKLFDEAGGATEQQALERLYSAYFPTSVGDNAADRLGDLYFEQGRFDRAADCWLAVLRERPDTDLSPATLAVKAALALSRASRWSELAQIRGELADRHADEEVTIAGRTGSPAEILRELLGDGPKAGEAGASAPGSSEQRRLDLPEVADAVWQVRFGDSVVAGMTAPELAQWESNGLSAVVPAAAVEGSTLFANYLGHDFAVDLESGKMLWRSAPFHHVEVAAMQDFARMVDPTRYAVVASGDRVWSLGRDLKDQNYYGPFRLTCRRADVGDVVWQSADLPDYAGVDLNGPPLLAGGKLFIPAKTMMNQQQGPPAQYILAVQPWDGKILWKAEVGTLRQGQMYYYYGMRTQEPQPKLLYRAGTVFADTHIGVLARLDADSGDLDWGYGYPTDPAQSEGRFIFWGGYPQPAGPASDSSQPLPVGEALLVKGAKSDRLYALDADRMRLLWDRPIAKSARLLGAEGDTAFLGGPEIDAMDLRSRKLLWSMRVPAGSEDAKLLVGADGIWQMTPRGIYEVDPGTGDVRRIFRGDDTGAAGGDLYLTDRLLLSVSNRTISAYARRTAGGGDEANKKGEADE